MKLKYLLETAIAIALWPASGAHAGHDSLILFPPSTNFELRGELALMNSSTPIICAVIFSGMTSAGGDKMHAGSITGAKAKRASCPQVTFYNLPWNIDVLSGKAGGTANIIDFSYQVGQTNCVAGLSTSISKKGAWTVSNPNACGASGTLKSMPTVTVQKQ